MCPAYDLICPNDHVQHDQMREYKKYGVCPECHESARPLWLSAPALDIWGGPKFVKSLDRQFDSKSEMKRELKRCGVEPAGDTVGGARNNDGFKGSKFSYAGQSNRG